MHPIPDSRYGAVAVLLVLGAAALLFARTERADARGSQKVNINTATEAELAYLPRLGAKVAARIVEHRKEKPFARPEDLMEVKGIGEKLFLDAQALRHGQRSDDADRQGPLLLLCFPPLLPRRRRRRSPPPPSRWARDGDHLARPGPSGPRASLPGAGVSLVELSCDPGCRSRGCWSLATPGVTRLRRRSSRCARPCTRRAWRSTGRARTRSPRNRNVGLKFRKNGDRYEWALYADGNGNGVRSAEIASGVDESLGVYLPWSRNDVLPGDHDGHPRAGSRRAPDTTSIGSTIRSDSTAPTSVRFRRWARARRARSTSGTAHDRMAVLRVFGADGEGAEALLPAGRERMDAMIIPIEPGQREDGDVAARRRPREGLSHGGRRPGCGREPRRSP